MFTRPISNGPITRAEGSDVILECEASGKDLTYHWRRVSKSLPSTISRSTNGKNLTIHDINIADSGQYYCEVTNGTNSVSSIKVQVTVKSEYTCLAMHVIFS